MMKQDNLKHGSDTITVNLFDRRIDFMSMETILKIICEKAIRNEKFLIASYNVHSFNLSMHLNSFFEYQKNAHIARCDGTGIIKGLELLGINIPLKFKISGTELVPKLIEQCYQNNISIFLLGTKPEIIELAILKQKAKYKKLRISGHHGYFDKEDSLQNQKVIQQINYFNPDILIVGMGMPVQETWIQKNQEKIDANVIIPCGAVIDRLAGLVSKPPVWISNAGLEWLYRLIKEPKRLASRYILGNPLFLFHILWGKYNNSNSISIVKHKNLHETNESANKTASLKIV